MTETTLPNPAIAANSSPFDSSYELESAIGQTVRLLQDVEGDKPLLERLSRHLDMLLEEQLLLCRRGINSLPKSD